MRKGTWKTNPTDLGTVQEPEGLPVPWAASPGGFQEASVHSNECETLLWQQPQVPASRSQGLVRFHDIVASLQVSHVPCVTLTMLRAYQSGVFMKQIHRKKKN